MARPGQPHCTAASTTCSHHCVPHVTAKLLHCPLGRPSPPNYFTSPSHGHRTCAHQPGATRRVAPEPPPTHTRARQHVNAHHPSQISARLAFLRQMMPLPDIIIYQQALPTFHTVTTASKPHCHQALPPSTSIKHRHQESPPGCRPSNTRETSGLRPVSTAHSLLRNHISEAALSSQASNHILTTHVLPTHLQVAAQSPTTATTPPIPGHRKATALPL